jgi:adenylosuccinate synthase
MVENWKSLKTVFFRTTGWNETKIKFKNSWDVPFQDGHYIAKMVIV